MDQIPDELLYTIMYKLKYRDIVELSRVDKRVSLLYQNRYFWERKIEIISPSRTNQLTSLSIDELVRLYKIISNSGKGYIYVEPQGVPGSLWEIKPTPIYGFDNIVQIACGDFHTALITDQGDIYTFGFGGYGQLGLGNYLQNNVPTRISGLPKVKQVACGRNHSALITDQGELYTFGRNKYGQLGLLKYKEAINVPQQIPLGGKVKQVSCGNEHTALVTERGEIFTCGAGWWGNLGLGNKNDAHTFHRIEQFFDVDQVSCGENHTAFITKQGNIYTFGRNNYGQLGLGDDLERLTPTQILGFTDVKYVSCGKYYTIFLTGAGKTYVFGDGSDGQLGLANISSLSVPTELKNFNFVAVSGGAQYTLYLDNRGYCYISGIFYSLNTAYKIDTPSPLPNISEVIQISTGRTRFAFISRN